MDINSPKNKKKLDKQYQSYLNKKENEVRLKQGASFVGSSNDPFATPTRDNYQTYPYDYFAGADCKIFFGDIWVDDIVTIQYDVSQTKTPIYGYASQNFDAIAKGQVIVQGSLAVSFKETGYLNVVQATLEEQLRRTEPAAKAKIQKHQDGADKGQQKFIPGLMTTDESKSKIDFSFSPTGTPQIIRQQQTIEQILADKKGQTTGAIAALNEHYKGTNAKDFEDFAEILEDSIWGDSNGETLSLENQLKRTDEFDYNTNGGISTFKNVGNYAKCLNIMLTFGDINDYRAEHTLLVLNDVHFLSSSMVVNPNGDPIAEVYSFIARDVNKTITTSPAYNIEPIKFDVGNGQKISRLEDVQSIEDKLNQEVNAFNAKVIATYLEGGSWAARQYDLGITEFAYNKITPFTDQVISSVENLVNSYIPSGDENDFSDSSQLMIEVQFQDKNDIIMILQQTVPQTYTYKVISPVRTGFKANNILTREDIFAEPLPPPVQESLSKDQQDKNKDIAEKAEIDTPADPDSVAMEKQTKEESKNLQTQNKNDSFKTTTDYLVESGMTQEEATDKVNSDIRKEQERVNREARGNEEDFDELITISPLTIDEIEEEDYLATQKELGIKTKEEYLEFVNREAVEENTLATKVEISESNFSDARKRLGLRPPTPEEIQKEAHTESSTQSKKISLLSYGVPTPDKLPSGSGKSRKSLYNDALKEYENYKRPQTINKVTITLTDEERAFLPFAPAKIEIDIVDKIVPTDAGNMAYAGGISIKPGKISVARTKNPEELAEVLGHELIHQDQYGRYSTGRPDNNYIDYQNELRQGSYLDRKNEIEAYKEASNLGAVLLKTRPELIQTITKEYDPWQDPRANISYYKDNQGNIIQQITK